MTDYNKAIAAGAASPFAFAAANFIVETLRLYELPEPLLLAAGAFVVSALNLVAVWATPDSRLKDAHVALGKRRLAGESE